ncbi:hypothetical protein PENTCL1PPCAC_19097, partial [Pristionchus entomophagus]
PYSEAFYVQLRFKIFLSTLCSNEIDDFFVKMRVPLAVVDESLIGRDDFDLFRLGESENCQFFTISS